VAPQQEASVRAIVLLDEAQVVVEEGGTVTTTHRRAVRLLTRDGRREATGRVIYMTGAGKVREIRGWIVWPNGDARKLGKDRVMDVELAPNDVYNEVRAQLVVGTDDAGPGVVFGYETVLEERSVFTQFEWQFQDDLPVVASAFALTLPPAWGADGVLYNHAPVDPVRIGASLRWELRDLAAIEREPARPAVTSIAPWLAVSLVPAPGARTGIGRVFDGWSDVARWLSELAEPQTVPSPDLREKTLSLTRDSRTDYERIQAIGRYAQGVKYVSIQTGVGRGGGYKPHAAAEVFAKSYGDCKDKANLMRAMLKVVGVDSYPVAIYSGDRARVREDWPSPQQFNHAIVAVRLKEEVEAPAVLLHPGLGRLLFFDPTDEHTPPGLVPEEEEGSLALLVSSDRGTLVSIPTSPAEANRVERRVDVALAGDGTVSGKVEEVAFGHAATAFRRDQEQGAAGDYRKRMEEWVGATGAGATMSGLETATAPNDGVRVAVTFKTPGYAKSMRGRLLVVKPALLPGRNRIYLSDTRRRYPVVLSSESFEEWTRITLPEGFDVDELPRPTRGRSPFGAHAASCEVKEGVLHCHRSVSVTAAVVPAERYREARDFFAWVNSAGSEPVVLARKEPSAPRN
jgi:hypothetical protein